MYIKRNLDKTVLSGDVSHTHMYTQHRRRKGGRGGEGVEERAGGHIRNLPASGYCV